MAENKETIQIHQEPCLYKMGKSCECGTNLFHLHEDYATCQNCGIQTLIRDLTMDGNVITNGYLPYSSARGR